MANAKDIILKPITAKEANELVKKLHYSGKVVQNSNIHIGVFLHGKLEGAMQFGSSLDKRKIMGLVKDTGWNEFIELNRMAFSEALPRNSESRALGIAMKLLKKFAPHIKWVISFADACQCGDGTIYRASGFVLTGIKKNTGMYLMPSGETCSVVTFCDGAKGGGIAKKKHGYKEGEGATRFMKRVGATQISGFQLRYIYFIDTTYRDRLTVKEIPYDKIKELGASMYRGKPAL